MRRDFFTFNVMYSPFLHVTFKSLHLIFTYLDQTYDNVIFIIEHSYYNTQQSMV